jgi:hypothetical protein
MEDRNPIHTMTLAKILIAAGGLRGSDRKRTCRSLYLRINSRRGYLVCIPVYGLYIGIILYSQSSDSEMASSFSTVNHMAWSREDGDITTEMQ